MFSYFLSRACKGVVSLFCLFALAFAQQDSNTIVDTLTQRPLPYAKRSVALMLGSPVGGTIILSPPTGDLGGAQTRKEIIVRDTRESRIFQEPQDFSIVSSDSWKGTGKNIADALKNETGIQSRKYGGTGSFQTISIRGIPGSKVLVFLDDIPLNSIDGSAVDLGKISPSLIHEIEIYKGITPASLGGNSIGGAVVLKTPASVDSFAGDVMAGVGSYGHVQSSLALSYPIKDLKNADGYTNISYESAENDFAYLDRNGTLYNLEDDRYRNQYNADYSAVTLVQRLRFKIPQKMTNLALSVKYQGSRQGLPGSEENPTPTASLQNSDLDMVLSGRYTGLLQRGLLLKGFVTVSRAISRYRWTSDDLVSSSFTSADIGNHERTILAKLMSQWNIFDGRIDLEFALQGKFDAIAPMSFTDAIKINDRAFNSEISAVFALDATYHFTERLSALVGGQIEGVHAHSNSPNDFYTYYTLGDSVNGEGTTRSQSGRVGFQFSLNPSAHFFANAGRYYRRPTLFERFGSNGQSRPNPNLIAEDGISVDCGIKGSISGLACEAIVFSTQNKHAISLLPTPQGLLALNMDESEIVGLEASCSAALKDKVFWRINATLQNPRCRSIFSDLTLKQIPDQAVFSGDISLVFKPYRFLSADYSFSCTSPVYFDYANQDQQPSHFIHNVKLSAQVGPRLSGIASINNVTDIFYYGSAYHAFPFPGREFFMTITYSL